MQGWQDIKWKHFLDSFWQLISLEVKTIDSVEMEHWQGNSKIQNVQPGDTLWEFGQSTSMFDIVNRERCWW